MKDYKNVIQKIRDLFNESTEFIPLHIPHFSGNEKKYVLECIESTFVSSVGQFVNDFEKSIENLTGAKRCVVCVNGTNAIHLALLASGVNEEDEVITQPLTFIATVNAISYARATPVFVDVDRDTMGLSPSSLKRFLEEETIMKNGYCYNKTSGRRIKACLPMHTFGHAARINEIARICQDYNLTLIEDAAEAIGSIYNGKHLGTYGLLGTFSFNGNKTMTTGGGGAIITDNEELADKIKHLSTQAKIPHKWKYEHNEIGYNYRMPNINAALGLAQIENLNYILDRKRALAEVYIDFFTSIGIDVFQERENETSNYWLNAVILEDNTAQQQFLTELNDAGVMCRPIWELMTDMIMFKDCQKSDLKNAKWLSERVVNIPSSVISRRLK
ncbi:aminotransferase in exopolysaccharide biosynthesis [Nonlabens dokdonensis]|jgi:perosamine synthetase|uniref:GDP-perosamine synthase n=2 Tax=Nonlabens dokdonensis TaxID=328515 RepID=L7WI54_NONDD|nr:LegC family aminotransferase [Nonlabens dokdonensis]AGC78683.1 DegT/DnrJ/EryC1/StrS family aminotransferase [Nonlabens dokdonensis DSW-6]PZX39190.1 aminotransferase in exopolysaccharide biosynthesis [Nonlabens dokdonensis]